MPLVGFEPTTPVHVLNPLYHHDQNFIILHYLIPPDPHLENNTIISLSFYCLLLGLLKLVLGIRCNLAISHAGLGIFWDNELQQYYEPELQGYTVVYNGQGMPVHPKQ